MTLRLVPCVKSVTLLLISCVKYIRLSTKLVNFTLCETCEILGSCLSQLFLTALRTTPTPQQKDMIESAAQIIAQDNAELACAYIQKTAVEKVLPEIDKRLATVKYCVLDTQMS